MSALSLRRQAGPRALLAAAALLALGLCHVTPAAAYEPLATHPGLTARAALASKRLHRFLRRDCGDSLGLFAPLTLDAEALGRRGHRLLRRKLQRLDPAGGYRPDDRGEQRAVGWLLAGSVLADMPASSNRHHFYSPVTRRGLDDRRPLLGGLFSLLAVFEGGDTVRQLLTASGFDLTGRPATHWITAKDNPQSIERLYEHLRRSVVEARPKRRAHHRAQAMIALGGLLNVLQDMTVPSQVRDDYVGGRARRLGRSVFDRGDPYERWVSIAYGQLGLPAGAGKPPVFERARDYFSNERWTGLADRTAVAHFSAGTVPPQVDLPHPAPRALHRRLAAKMPYAKPPVPRFDYRRCPPRRTCYVRGQHGPVLAYRIDPRRKLLRFFLDERCFSATARHVLPLAVSYSTGLVDFLLRGQIALDRSAKGIRIRNTGPKIAKATLALVHEDPRGLRSEILSREGTAADGGARLATLPLAADAKPGRYFVVVDGHDPRGERILAVSHLTVSAAAPSAAATQPSSKPASAPASSPATRPTSRPIWQQ